MASTYDIVASGIFNMSAADSPQRVQSDHHYPREGSLSLDEIDRTVQKAESSVLEVSLQEYPLLALVVSSTP